MPIAIVSDTTADLPQELIADLPIRIVPNILVLEGKSFLDGQDITREDFYAKLPTLKTNPTTASPASGTFQRLYEDLLASGYTEIISIHPPAGLSGLFNSASIAARTLNPRVTVVDSAFISLGLGFQALCAAEDALRGLSVPAILEHLNGLRDRIQVTAMLDTLEFVRRSGRVSWARASLGSLMNIKPFIALKDGKVISLGESRTRHRGIDRLREMLHSLGVLDRLAILHTNAETEAVSFLNSLRVDVHHAPFIVNVTTVIGTHTGPNGLGYAALLQ